MGEESKTGCAISKDLDELSGFYRKIKDHPCYDAKAAHRFGRIHLPVAPKCNIQCNYCVRKFDCVNESRPGITSEVLSPVKAAEVTEKVIREHPNISVIGIAGPGDPLYNPETFETLSLLKKSRPELLFCLSTNGMLLPERVDELVEYGVTNLTVTLNTVNPKIGAKIYSFVYQSGTFFKGIEGAILLLENQLKGIEKAVKAGMVVKINTVLIPTVNDGDIKNVSKTAREIGAYMQNVMPLLPQYKFSDIPRPGKEFLSEIRNKCEKNIRQMRHCRQCRSDAVGKLEESFTCSAYKSMKEIPAKDLPTMRQDTDKYNVINKIKIAVATSDKSRCIDEHFGNTRLFSIYEGDVASMKTIFVEKRIIPNKFCDKEECITREGKETLLMEIMNLLKDCEVIICRRIGKVPRKWLEDFGLEVREDCGEIEKVIDKVLKEYDGSGSMKDQIGIINDINNIS